MTSHPFITQDGSVIERSPSVREEGNPFPANGEHKKLETGTSGSFLPNFSAVDIGMIVGLRRRMSAEQVSNFIRTPDRDLSAEEVERVIAEHGRVR